MPRHSRGIVGSGRMQWGVVVFCHLRQLSRSALCKLSRKETLKTDIMWTPPCPFLACGITLPVPLCERPHFDTVPELPCWSRRTNYDADRTQWPGTVYNRMVGTHSNGQRRWRITPDEFIEKWAVSTPYDHYTKMCKNLRLLPHSVKWLWLDWGLSERSWCLRQIKVVLK